MIPWMSTEEINLIESFLKPNMTMLEWGSGGSTIKFSQKVSKYYSIEHVKDWYTKVNKELVNLKLDNKVNNFLIEPDYPRTLPTKYREFKTYIEYVDQLNIMFDVVLIDGRARAQCAKKVLKYLKDDAVVFIHDFWARPQYHSVLEFYEEVASVKHDQSLVTLKKKENEDIIYPTLT